MNIKIEEIARVIDLTHEITAMEPVHALALAGAILASVAHEGTPEVPDMLVEFCIHAISGNAQANAQQAMEIQRVMRRQP